jgi:hypothetical protein
LFVVLCRFQQILGREVPVFKCLMQIVMTEIILVDWERESPQPLSRNECPSAHIRFKDQAAEYELGYIFELLIFLSLDV